MVRATLTVQHRKAKPTIEKCYGFAPDAGQKLMDRYGQRMTQAQALTILGISDTKFRKDRNAGLFGMYGDEKCTWYKAKELYDYWWKQTSGAKDESDSVVTSMSELRKRIAREKREAAEAKVTRRRLRAG